MGTLRASTYLEGVTVNGVTLGQPATLIYDTTTNTLRPQQPGDPASSLVFAYDDATLPDGTVTLDASGTPVVTPDPTVLP